MTGFLTLLVAVIVLTLSNGCATTRGAPPGFPTSLEALKQLDPQYDETLNAYYLPGADQRAVRNKFIETRLGAVDTQYLSFKESLYTQAVASNVFVDLATIGLNVAGVATPGASTKTILHGASGGLLGAKASIDKNVFFERTMPALMSQMEALRKTVRARILEGMAKTVDAYPLSQAVSDLQDYYVAGTIPGAIVGVTKDAIVSDGKADEKVELALKSAEQIRAELTGRGYSVVTKPVLSGNERDILIKYLKPDGKNYDQARMKVLSNWLKTQNIQHTVMYFLSAPDYSKERQSAVEYLVEKGYLQQP